jgi:hypothetical protein
MNDTILKTTNDTVTQQGQKIHKITVIRNDDFNDFSQKMLFEVRRYVTTWNIKQIIITLYTDITKRTSWSAQDDSYKAKKGSWLPMLCHKMDWELTGN